MWSLTTPVITLSKAQEPQMVKATKTGFVQGNMSSKGLTLCHSCPFMNANRVNIESAMDPNISLTSSGMESGSSTSWPQPIILVVRIAREYRATNVSTSTQNMLCIALTTPMASWRRGRIALTTRTNRSILINRSMRANIIIFPRLPLLPDPTSCCVKPRHASNTHWSKTPLRTIERSNKFQPRSSESVKKPSRLMRILNTSSKTKNISNICSTQNHTGDFMSVSMPIVTALRTMTKPTMDWNLADSTHFRSVRINTRASRKILRNLTALKRMRIG
mmetsp:Transcript_101180/g.262038  ORF Transcript_101180/g.262038 Transcript_101180/m.262038 type:complete len:276 (+) Transcript_101180:894-1721(+)